MHRRKGIDVSYADGRIDWRRVKQDGIEFAMVRAGFGDGNIDHEFDRNARNVTVKGFLWEPTGSAMPIQRRWPEKKQDSV